MNRPRPNTFLAALLCALASTLPVHAAESTADPADPLAANFQNPPESAKPWTWWHWVSGNVSREGITADLEAMKKIGLGGAQLFTVDQSEVHGPVKFMSPEWRDLVKFAFSEAARLHLTMSMEGCDGWSETGGPWVTSPESMKKVVWTERTIDGGASVPLDLPQPETIGGYYQDIALCAYPALAESGTDRPASLTSSDPKFVAGDIATSGTSQIHLTAGQTDWLQANFAAPVSIRSVQFRVSGSAGIAPWQIESSSDGTQFSKIADSRPGDVVLPQPVTAQYFRLSIATPHSGRTSVSGLKFGGPTLDQFTARSGMSVSIDANKFTDTSFSADEKIDPAKLVTLTGQKTWAAPAGKWTIVRIGATSTGVTTHPSTTPGLECDKLSAQAVSDHINSMFNPVFQDFPGAVGSTFKYILLDSWEAKCENWTPDMPAQFKTRRGYDLTPWLPALTGKVVGSAEQTQRFLWDFRRTLADLVAEEHYKVIQDFAHQHNMGLASEATGIGIPTVADQLLCKKYTDITMGEFWVNKSREENIDDSKEAASAAHVYGMKVAGAESFTSRPQTAAWTNDPYSLKALGDEEFCVGINRFIFHRYAHQPWMDRIPGMSMGPWGINFERTNTWWEPGAAWISYITRCQYLLQQGRYIADLCYYYGESAPATVHHADLDPQPPQGYSYDVVNTDALINLMTVKDGQIALPDGMRYRVLILPPTDRMTVAVLKKIAQLVDAGATVYGPKPTHSPSLADSDPDVAKIANDLWGSVDDESQSASEHAHGNGRIVYGEPLSAIAKVGPDFSTDHGDFMFIHRLIGDADVYFISNQSHQEAAVKCTFRVARELPELWCPDNGVHKALAQWETNGTDTTVPLNFDPSGSAFVVFRHITANSSGIASINPEPLAVSNAIDDGITFLADKSGDYTATTATGVDLKATVPQLPAPIDLSGPWQLTFPPKLGAPASATFDKLISWTDSPIDGIKYFSGTAIYKTKVTIPNDFRDAKGRKLLLDLGQVKNLARVIFNGHDLGVLWKPPFRTDITAAIRSGDNDLEIRVTNLWPNRLIGDQKLPEAQRITWTSVSLYKADSPLLPSGLLGPVKITPAQQVTLAVPAR